MEVHIYSVKAKKPKVKWKHKKAKAARYSARDLKHLHVLPENPAVGRKSSRERCWIYVISVFEKTPKTWRIKEGHSWSIAIICWGYMLTLQSDQNEMIEPAGTFGTMPQEPWHPGKGAKPDCVIQLYFGKVRTHASYKTTRTWENFNNRETKMILFSDELWLIANNSKSFANTSKTIIRNNLGLWKHPEVYLISGRKI